MMKNEHDVMNINYEIGIVKHDIIVNGKGTNIMIVKHCLLNINHDTMNGKQNIMIVKH